MITKYRGLSISDNNKGQWVYGNLIVDGNYAYIVNGVIECNDQYITIAEWCPVDPKTIGAFTGLFDKNNKEIFEGDVVRVTCEHPIDFPDCQGVVRMLEGRYMVCDDKTERGSELFSEIFLNEIIGNIYENPELMEEVTND